MTFISQPNPSSKISSHSRLVSHLGTGIYGAFATSEQQPATCSSSRMNISFIQNPVLDPSVCAELLNKSYVDAVYARRPTRHSKRQPVAGDAKTVAKFVKNYMNHLIGQFVAFAESVHKFVVLCDRYRFLQNCYLMKSLLTRLFHELPLWFHEGSSERSRIEKGLKDISIYYLTHQNPAQALTDLQHCNERMTEIVDFKRGDFYAWLKKIEAPNAHLNMMYRRTMERINDALTTYTDIVVKQDNGFKDVTNNDYMQDGSDFEIEPAELLQDTSAIAMIRQCNLHDLFLPSKSKRIRLAEDGCVDAIQHYRSMIYDHAYYFEHEDHAEKRRLIQDLQSHPNNPGELPELFDVWMTHSSTSELIDIAMDSVDILDQLRRQIKDLKRTSKKVERAKNDRKSYRPRDKKIEEVDEVEDELA